MHRFPSLARACRQPWLTGLLLVCWAAPAAAQSAPKLNIVHPLPPQTPPWLEGYRLRWPVRVLGDPATQQAQTVVVRLPTGGWLKSDASDLAVQAATGQLLPAAVLSHDPAGETVLQFKRRGDDAWYWVYGVNAKGPPAPRADPKTDAAFREGVVLEVRAWAGDDLGSWAKVREGLQKSERLLANAVVADVFQNCNPARPDQSSPFAASYRGFFHARKEGTYRFLLNADDASFLFVDGFKVFERPGTNRPLGQIKVKELEKLSGRVDLKAGVHAFEVHQAVGAHPDAAGVCALLWSPPGEKKFTYLPPAAIAHPLYARAAALEKEDGETAGLFVHGIDDTLEVPGLKLFLVRFEAQGPGKNEDFVWDFGDGTTGKGRSVVHVYFKEADHTVTLTAPSGLPPCRQRLRVWAEPGETSPLSLGLAVEALAAMEWRKLTVPRLREIFTFLTLCEQPNRWLLLEEVARQLLAEKGADLDLRAQLYVARMEALTRLGRAAEALKLAEQVRPEFAKTPVLQVRLQLETAAIHQYHYRDAAAASKIYKAILDEHRRTEHPNLRLAAVRWGDLFAEAGDLVRASETYRLAATLGGEKLVGTATTDASTRGALLRIAEQKLRAGDIHATRQLLARIELEHPGRRLDGLYCFLRAESDRFAGRYEDALRHYEMIFKLPQWAGYRGRATAGIADTYVRMGELKKTRKALGDLKEGFKKEYEERKGAEIEKLIDERLRRLAALGNKGARGLFEGFATGFEPDEAKWFGDLGPFAAVRALGFQGPHVLMLDVYPRDFLSGEYNRPLKNLTPGGAYWVEIWYRDVLRPLPPPGHDMHLNAYLFGETPARPSVTAQQMVYRNAHHGWHKLGFKLRAPLVQDCLLKITFMNTTGLMVFDRLSIRPVSDRQLDALLSFQEGSKAP